MFPDLLVSDLEFRASTRISDANPQQADFHWGTAELYRWTSLDGRKLEGILHKPEGFDPARQYPMIVQFFHKSSDQLFHHRAPELHRSRIDYHYFVSNGYIVFTPDIYFDAGYIGESAYKSIMPGVTALIDEGFVDPRRVMAQGHSYSGYQVAYLVMRTNLFACVQAGLPDPPGAVLRPLSAGRTPARMDAQRRTRRRKGPQPRLRREGIALTYRRP